MASSFSRNVPLIETVAIDRRMTYLSKDQAQRLVLDFCDGAQLVRRGRRETEELRYAGICSNSMSVPTCTAQPFVFAARRNGVISCFITTSPTNEVGAILATSIH